MKSMTMLLLIVFLQSIASPVFAESADTSDSKAIEVELGTVEAMLNAGVQQDLVACMDMQFPLNIDNIEIIEELSSFHYLSAHDRIAEDRGYLYKLVELDPAYEYFEDSTLGGPWDEDVAIPFRRHIFFSADDKIIGEYVRFRMDDDVDLGLATSFMNMAEDVARTNFGHVAKEISPQTIEFWNYKFWLTNDYDDELEFSWYGQFVVFILRAGDQRPEEIDEQPMGLWLLSEEERANGDGH